MRILHIVTLIDDHSSYGGPLTVAVGHCGELTRRGHEVEILAGWRGHGQPPSEIEGVTAHLFAVHPVAPRLRYSGLFSPAMILWLRRHARNYDVAHIHLARDLVPLSAAAILRHENVPYVTQTHGMVAPDRRHIARFVDSAFTVPTLHGATTRFVLTEAEEGHLTDVTGPNWQLTRLPNGVVGVDTLSVVRGAGDKRPLDVLFLARLHPRKRVLAFAKMATTLLAQGAPATFAVVGPDDGDLPALQRMLDATPAVTGRLVYEGALSHPEALLRIRRADIYVLPSVDEPYPMTLLEAVAAGVPSLCTTSCGIAQTLAEHGGAVVVDHADDAMTAALADLIDDTGRRARLSVAASRASREVFSLDGVVGSLEASYRLSIAKSAKSGQVAVRQRLLWVTNLVTPYRLPLWRELSKTVDLTVAVLADSEVNRGWHIDLSREDFAFVALHATVLRSSVTMTLYAPSLRLLTLVGRRPAAIVMDGWESPAFLTAAVVARLCRVRLVASYRSTRSTHRFSGGPISWLRARFFRSADAVMTAGGPSTDAVLAMGVPSERINVGFNTVDVEAFARSARASRPRVHLADGHHYLYVGQLIERKNVTNLIRAFAVARDPSDTVTIVGAGPLDAELRRAAVAAGVDDAITFSGHLAGDDLMAAYATSDTLVLPSTQEVWGLVVNEALAAGLHVVVSDRCGIVPVIASMPGVWICAPTSEGISDAMAASRRSWQGPTQDHPILEHTPAALAKVVLACALPERRPSHEAAARQQVPE